MKRLLVCPNVESDLLNCAKNFSYQNPKYPKNIIPFESSVQEIFNTLLSMVVKDIQDVSGVIVFTLMESSSLRSWYEIKIHLSQRPSGFDNCINVVSWGDCKSPIINNRPNPGIYLPKMSNGQAVVQHSIIRNGTSWYPTETRQSIRVIYPVKSFKRQLCPN